MTSELAKALDKAAEELKAEGHSAADAEAGAPQAIAAAVEAEARRCPAAQSAWTIWEPCNLQCHLHCNSQCNL